MHLGQVRRDNNKTRKKNKTRTLSKRTIENEQKKMKYKEEPFFRKSGLMNLEQVVCVPNVKLVFVKKLWLGKTKNHKELETLSSMG